MHACMLDYSQKKREKSNKNKIGTTKDGWMEKCVPFLVGLAYVVVALLVRSLARKKEKRIKWWHRARNQEINNSIFCLTFLQERKYFWKCYKMIANAVMLFLWICFLYVRTHILTTAGKCSYGFNMFTFPFYQSKKIKFCLKLIMQRVQILLWPLLNDSKASSSLSSSCH